MDAQHRVEAGYDHMAEGYLSSKDAHDPVTLAALDELARGLPDSGTVLDLGCGAGVPVTQWLARRYDVTGVDVSAGQLDLARQHVPGATLIKASMTDVRFGPGTFDAVVAFYSIIHVPRAEHPWLAQARRPVPRDLGGQRVGGRGGKLGRLGRADVVEPPRRGDKPRDASRGRIPHRIRGQTDER